MAVDVQVSAVQEVRPRTRLSSLDGLRGLAALAVVIYHYGYRSAQIYPSIGEPLPAVAAGQYGVQLFFVISGFVIVMTMQRMTPGSFVVSRFIRLYPIYWICLTITFALVAIAGLPGREVSLGAALVNLTMLQQYVGVPAVDGAYWTLSAELAFYFQIGVLFFGKFLQGRRLIPTLYTWLGCAAVVNQLSDLRLSASADAVVNALDLGLTWAPLFVSGIAAYHIWSGSRSTALYLVPVATTVYMLAAKGYLVAGATICVFVLFTLALWGPTLRCVKAPLSFLGAISYPLYLIHQNVGYVLILFLRSVGLGHFAAATITLAVVIAVAALLNAFVDVPLRAVLRRLLARWLKPRETSAWPIRSVGGSS